MRSEISLKQKVITFKRQGCTSEACFPPEVKLKGIDPLVALKYHFPFYRWKSFTAPWGKAHFDAGKMKCGTWVGVYELVADES